MDEFTKRVRGDGWQHEGLKFPTLQALCDHFGADYHRVYYSVLRKRNMTLAEAISRNPYERTPLSKEALVLRAIREVPDVAGDLRWSIKQIGTIVARYLKENPDVQNQP